MATAGVAQLKASLSRYLARVKAGEELVVTERGRPVAKLVPIRDHEAGAGWARLSAMERRGEISLGSGRLPDEFWDLPRPNDPTGSVREALIEEREEGW
ncbi:MAG: type II toxin-antitoxin system prevent-host-death family antitoxin [Actinobacteria bacterium]|nr:type II toxin-antitoxin system prevent-host-death family antitoxin [Actinomycetota bacterium]